MSLIKRAIMTEKSVKFSEQGAYVFEVTKKASKDQILKAVETTFNVKVKSVNTMIVRSKPKRTRKGLIVPAKKWKKAIVTLNEGQKIALLEGV